MLDSVEIPHSSAQSPSRTHLNQSLQSIRVPSTHKPHTWKIQLGKSVVPRPLLAADTAEQNSHQGSNFLCEFGHHNSLLAPKCIHNIVPCFTRHLNSHITSHHHNRPPPPKLFTVLFIDRTCDNAPNSMPCTLKESINSGGPATPSTHPLCPKDMTPERGSPASLYICANIIMCKSQMPLKQDGRGWRGATPPHCSLNNSIVTQKLQSIAGHGRVAPQLQAHLLRTSPPTASANSLQPSPEPSKAISTMPSRPPAHLIQGTSQLHQAFLEAYHPAELIVAHSLGSARGTDGKWTARGSYHPLCCKMDQRQGAGPPIVVACCLHCSSLKTSGLPRGLKERLKARSALQLLSLCLPASPQGRVQQHPQNMPISHSRKRKLICNKQEPFPMAVLSQLRHPQSCFASILPLHSQPGVILGPLHLE